MSQPRLRLTLALMLAAGMVWANVTAGEPTRHPPLLQSKVYLQISPNGRDDLDALFVALEESVAANEPQTEPVIIVLHGTEAVPFIRRHYSENRELVDRAVKLAAFNRIELRMCETWMRDNGYRENELLPFVDLVPFAPAEVERLERDGYVPYQPEAPRPLL